MAGDANPAPSPGGPEVDDPDDAARLAQLATALADGVEAALPVWVRTSVERVATDQGITVDADLRAEADRAGERARQRVGGRLRELLATDVDAQPTGPLALIRTAVAEPTGVLADAGAGPVIRDDFRVEAFPDDPYDLTPATFGDLDPELTEAGVAWGAAKAHVILARRRAEGRR